MNSQDIVDAVISNAYASDITTLIKDTLMTKSLGKIEQARPEFAADLFGGNYTDEDYEE